MKKSIVFIVVILAMLMLAACSGGVGEAKAVLESYVQNIADGDYEAAYELITKFDKENTSRELFVKWNTAVAKVQQTESFNISDKIDKLKKYKYMGYEFGDAYGLEVTRTLKKMISDIDMTGYEGETFRILVASGEGEWRAALLITEMESNLERLEKALSDYEDKTK